SQNDLCNIDPELLSQPRRCVVPELVGMPVPVPPPELRLIRIETLGEWKRCLTPIGDGTAVAAGVVYVAGTPLGPPLPICAWTIATAQGSSSLCVQTTPSKLIYISRREDETVRHGNVQERFQELLCLWAKKHHSLMVM